MAETETPERRLARLGLVLPPAPAPVGRYVPYRRAGDLLFLSGQGPRLAGGGYHEGQVGTAVTVAEAYEHARLVGLQLLAVMRSALGSLDRVAGIVKLLGMVNAAPGFRDHPAVINGCSELLEAVFGEEGRHARSAVGMGSLPNNITVEIEAIVAIRP
jgi:enamine deaminase RidA (YjgF/YER057c/UK114 family)